jgi:hypothetical protein
MPTLLGHLAQFATFTSQGEVLCTQGFGYLLSGYAEARQAFAEEISTRTGVTLGKDVAWFAERRQADGTRPDLEARNGEKPVAKIEAKLDAPFDHTQLRAYFGDLQGHLAGTGRTGLLAALVPRRREQAANDTLRAVFALTGESPWRVGGDGLATVAICVVTWDDVLACLAAVESPV